MSFDVNRAGRDPFPGSRPALIGHRGAPAYAPEHTATSYRLAIAQGADFVEPDVVPTRDGVLVLRHEPLLDHTTDIGAHPELAARRSAVVLDGVRHEGAFTHAFAWDELRVLRATEPMPELRPESDRRAGREALLRLRDLVELLETEAAAGRPCGLVVELKHTAAYESAGVDVIDLLERELDGLWHSPALQGLVLESFERGALRRAAERGLPASLVALMAAQGGPGDGEGTGAGGSPSYADELTPAGLDALAEWVHGISVSDRQLDVHDGDARDGAEHVHPDARDPLVEAAHDRGLRVATYTLRPEDAFLPAAFAGRPEAYWRGVLATGVDAVFADAPDRVRAMIDELWPGG